MRQITRLIIISVLLFVLAVVPACAQDADDSGSWLSLQGIKSLDKWYLTLRLEHRTNENFGNTEAFFVNAGGGYSFTKWLKTDLNYEYWVLPGNDTHKIVLCTTGTLAREGLKVSLREKLEFAIPAGGGCPSWLLRSRLRTQYTIQNSIFCPYLMVEPFTWEKLKRTLFYAGTELAVSEHSRFDVFYLYNLPRSSHGTHTIGLGYVLSF